MEEVVMLLPELSPPLLYRIASRSGQTDSALRHSPIGEIEDGAGTGWYTLSPFKPLQGPVQHHQLTVKLMKASNMPQQRRCAPRSQSAHRCQLCAEMYSALASHETRSKHDR